MSDKASVRLRSLCLLRTLASCVSSFHVQGLFPYVFPRKKTTRRQHLRPPAGGAFSNRRPSPARGGSVANREALYALLEPYEAHVITGHTHEHEHVFEGGVHEHVLGTACGAWWSGPICHDGTPSGYGVFEMDGEDLRWRYKATGQPDDHQLRVYPRGSDPRTPREIVANVWDWDPEYGRLVRGGDRRGAMARRVGTDPLSETLHRGNDAPAHRPWVEPKPTDHLFYAPVGPEATDLRVEATDRFGRTYSATPEKTT